MPGLRLQFGDEMVLYSRLTDWPIFPAIQVFGFATILRFFLEFILICSFKNNSLYSVQATNTVAKTLSFEFVCLIFFQKFQFVSLI